MGSIELLRGDITKIKSDCIVNAANTSLLGGGGVDGAIHRAGGKEILEECQKIRDKQGGCKVGEAVATTAGNLPAKYVIHTVGPTWNEGKSNEEERLVSCYFESLKLAESLGMHSIAFPNISTGIYKFPKEKAAEIAIATLLEMRGRLKSVNKVVFVCFDEENYTIYEKKLGELG
ncbi:MAG: O-acetyl-ADP-ribose deacetylase (regulator of RNase III) [Crocinitomicaceae bacterium]|jgi:O-acetyl-ADP-ribose deacetylase (regulator of RNase III)